MRRALAVAAMCLAAAAACAGIGAGYGDSLVDDGAPGKFGIPHAKAGEQDWFALPRFHNRTDKPVHILDIKLADLPSQIRVLRYRGQSAKAVGWIQLGYRAGGNANENPLNTPELPIRDIVAPPHGRADGYVMMLVELLQAKRVEMKRALVRYEVAGHVYEQMLTMDLVLTPGTS